MVLRGLLLLFIIALTVFSACSSPAPRPFPPPEGYSSWEQYYSEHEARKNTPTPDTSSNPSASPAPAPATITIPEPAPKAPTSSSNFQIIVRGTAGLKFSGSYMTVTWDGKTTSRTVDGTVPAEYSASGMIASVAFQKQVESGTLIVEIFKAGQLLNAADTSAAYGVVLVATQ